MTADSLISKIINCVFLYNILNPCGSRYIPLFRPLRKWEMVSSIFSTAFVLLHLRESGNQMAKGITVVLQTPSFCSMGDG